MGFSVYESFPKASDGEGADDQCEASLLFIEVSSGSLEEYVLQTGCSDYVAAGGQFPDLARGHSKTQIPNRPHTPEALTQILDIDNHF